MLDNTNGLDTRASHVQSTNIEKIVLQGKVEANRKRGNSRTTWMSAIEKITGLNTP